MKPNLLAGLLLLAMVGCSTVPPAVIAPSPPAPPPAPQVAKRTGPRAMVISPAPSAQLQASVSRKITPAPSVTLGWDASPTTSVTGYNLYSGSASRAYSAVTDAGNGNTITVSNPAFSTTYFFTVTAYVSSGQESDYSNEVTFTTPGQVLPPGNLLIQGSFALAPDGPWLPETNWPPILVSNPLGNQFWKVQATLVP